MWEGPWNSLVLIYFEVLKTPGKSPAPPPTHTQGTQQLKTLEDNIVNFLKDFTLLSSKYLNDHIAPIIKKIDLSSFKSCLILKHDRFSTLIQLGKILVKN